MTANQRAAVEHREGPLLILAGPGSGKTRVITHRIAGMTADGIDPRNILAITFTNKAANEMVERVAALIPGVRVWISTFHRFCARLLRQRAEVVGLQSNFSILDSADQKQLVRQILSDLDIDAVHFPPRQIAARISRAKNELKSAAEVARGFSDSVGNHLEAILARVYPKYQQRLLDSNAVDFDDLLLHVVTLISENPNLCSQLGERYRYVMVDEYQDTNLAQYRIVSALSAGHRNLSVTGDPDQSIYGWRGAKIENILRFERDFPNATVIRLEQNFRSTGRILKAADELIAHNVRRKAKRLITDKTLGEPVRLLRFDDALHEADAIAASIHRAVENGERLYSDFAVFYRINALSREVERALTRHQVPFQVASGLAFYDRAEIKDVLAYLRLINNPRDETAFRRIVNTPRRGLGKTTVKRISAWAERQGLNLLEAAGQAAEIDSLSKRSVTLVGAFAKLMTDLTQIVGETVAATIEIVLARTGYGSIWIDSQAEQDVQRLANVRELLTVAKQHDESLDDEATLENFLETTSLTNETDNVDDSAGRVTLMTLHAAKGLEFPVVYLLAVEQSLIPHERALRSAFPDEIEEERRLLFVGMTRAMQELFLTETRERNFRGRRLATIRSDFLAEMNLQSQDETMGFTADQWNRPQKTSLSSAEIRSGSGKFAARNLPLMTGADLLKARNGTATASAGPPAGFSMGMHVRHPQYGIGTVIETGGSPQRPTVTVAFRENDRIATYIADKSPLQPVGLPNP